MTGTEFQLLCAGILGATFCGYLYYRHKSTPPHETPDSVLGEVRILLAFERKRRAIKLLETELLRFPDSEVLAEKLRELRQEPT